MVADDKRELFGGWSIQPGFPVPFLQGLKYGLHFEEVQKLFASIAPL